ncbi:MAG: hypothetical protein FWC41_06445 [Firmicutes bacterium]|nr:hypothetical protein [Bacillota bacterium]
MDGILIVGIVFFTIYKTIELFVLQRERRLMISKMSEISPEMLHANINSLKIAQNDQSKSSQFLMLRLGGLALGIGAGWILGWVLNNTRLDIYQAQTNWYQREVMDSTIIATTALCVGVALIIVYLIERKSYKEAKRVV